MNNIEHNSHKCNHKNKLDSQIDDLQGFEENFCSWGSKQEYVLVRLSDGRLVSALAKIDTDTGEILRFIHPPLEKNAKSSSTFNCNSNKYNEIKRLTHNIDEIIQANRSKIVRENRARRYHLQNIAREIFLEEGLKSGLEFPANFHRTAQCQRVRYATNVGVHLSEEYGKAFYSGLVQCESVWTCAVCGAKIQARRILEVRDGVEWAYKNGFKCILVTLTFHHTPFQDCKDLLKRQAKALDYLRSGRIWKDIKEEIGYEGLIRSLEITFGESGWHPHTHELWIVDKDTDVEELKGKLLDRWKEACKRNGLLPGSRTRTFDERAVDIIDNAKTSDYLAKQSNVNVELSSGDWGIDEELVKQSTKASKKGKTPFDLLDDYANGDEKARELFLEYAFAVKGKRQLFWSRGLKKKVGLQDKTDKELLEEKREEAIEVAVLGDFQWNKICQEEARAEILSLAETRGPEGINDWLRRHGVFDRYSEVYSCIEGIDSS